MQTVTACSIVQVSNYSCSDSCKTTQTEQGKIELNIYHLSSSNLRKMIILKLDGHNMKHEREPKIGLHTKTMKPSCGKKKKKKHSWRQNEMNILQGNRKKKRFKS